MDLLWYLGNGILVYWALGSYLVYKDWDEVSRMVEEILEDPYIRGFLEAHSELENTWRVGIILFLTLACPLQFLKHYKEKAWRYLSGETPLQQSKRLLRELRLKSAEDLLPPEMRDRLRVIELRVEEIEKDLDPPEPWVSIKKIDPPPEDDS